MYFLWFYDLMVITRNHYVGQVYADYLYKNGWVGPGFLNAVNNYYGETIYR